MQRSSLNRVILIGRIGNKPESRYTPQGTSTSNFSVATNEVWGAGENRQEHTEWHNIVTWSKTADFVTKYLQKGQMVSVEGRLRTHSWTDKDENTRKSTEIVCNTITPLEWKADEPSETSAQVADEGEEELPF